MNEELTLCAAAFFKNIGKSVATSEEFLMTTSVNYHWFHLGDAKKILAAMLSEKILEKNGDIVKPCFDLYSVAVPIAYRPDANIASRCPAGGERKEAEDMHPKLMAKAVSSGMDKKNFISQANHLSKTLNVDMIVAELIVLRDNGIDIKEFVDPVYSEIARK